MKKYIMAFDAGTTSNRVILFDRKGRICALARRELRQIYPRPGWVEHDPEEIWRDMLEAAREALRLAGASADEIAGIGITNQRETTIVWERETGKPVYNAIVWQCRRTAEYCDSLKEAGYTQLLREKTGLVIDAYFSATKLRWILEQLPGARERAAAGELLFGTVESWLIWKLTGGRVHVSDYSNASRTMLFNIRELCWDEEILSLLKIPRQMLPEVRSSSCIYGETEASLFGGPIPIAGAGGDQQCALFGQGCFAPGDVKNTYGTGCFVLMNTGEAPVFSNHGLVTTIAWGLNGRVSYALEGSVYVAGAAIQWLRDEMGILRSAPEAEELASRVPDANGCYFVPAFTGLGAPYWDQYARGTIVGITRGVNRCHIVRAALESIAFLSCDVIEAMEADAGMRLRLLKVDGGASANDLLMQIQADLAAVPSERPACVETTALGAAYLAGLAAGFWESTEEILLNREVDRVFEPSMEEKKRRVMKAGWKRAVPRAFGWADRENGEKEE